MEESDIADVKAFKQTGIYSGKDQMRIGLSDFIADPEKNSLGTPSWKIKLASENYAKTGFPAVPTCRGMADDKKYPLRMVTPHSLHRINSSYSNVKWFREQEQQEFWMNPADAEKRNIQDRHKVLIHNLKGKIIIPVKVTEDIMPGVVCLQQGVWPDLDGDSVDRGGIAQIF